MLRNAHRARCYQSNLTAGMPLSLGITLHYTLGLIDHNKKTSHKNITFKISYPCNHKQKKFNPSPSNACRGVTILL
jgi:hypothetical protein